MTNVHLRDIDFTSEFEFQASRSSGPGGQNVNKVNSRIELRFHIENSNLLTSTTKALLSQKLIAKITSDGYLIIVSQESRSQLVNKQNCIEKFYQLIENATYIAKKRKASKPTFASKIKRLDSKKTKSIIKSLRKRPEL